MWRHGLAGYYTASISQLFQGEHLGSFFMEDWSKSGEYSSRANLKAARIRGRANEGVTTDQATLKKVSATHVIKLVFAPNSFHRGNMSSKVGNIVSNKCCLYLEAICTAWVAIFEIKISGNFECMVYNSLMYCTLKEENKDTSHMFCAIKRANERGILTPISIIRWRYFRYSLFLLKGIVKWQGRGGCEWYQSNRYDFPYNRRCFLGILTGLNSRYKSQKTSFSVSCKTMWRLFWWGSPVVGKSRPST